MTITMNQKGIHLGIGLLVTVTVMAIFVLPPTPMVGKTEETSQKPPMPLQTQPTAKPARQPAPKSSTDRWTYFRGNALSQGVATTTLPDRPELLWEFKVAEGAFEVTPAIIDGVVYIGDLDGALFALNLQDGTTLWKSEIESGFVSSPSYYNGHIYLGDYDGVFYCFRTKDGELVWKYETGAEVNSSANFYKDNVLVGSQDATLYCIHALTGALNWKHEIADQIRCSPTVVGDRTFVAGCDAKLHIIDLAKGTKVSEVILDGPTGSTPAVSGDHVYFGTEGASLYCINWKKAEVQWHYTNMESALPYRSSVALKDGILVIGGRNRLIQAFHMKTGKEAWQFKTNGRVDASPVIVGDRVFVAGSDGRISAFHLKTGKQTWEFEAGGDFIGSPAVAQQRLVIASGAGSVYCFGKK